MIQETLGNGVVTVRGFVPETGLVDLIQTTGPAGSVQDLRYLFDANGNLTAHDDGSGGAPERTASWTSCHQPLTLTGAAGSAPFLHRPWR